MRKRQRNRLWKLKHFEDQEMAPEQDDDQMQPNNIEDEEDEAAGDSKNHQAK